MAGTPGETMRVGGWPSSPPDQPGPQIIAVTPALHPHVRPAKVNKLYPKGNEVLFSSVGQNKEQGGSRKESGIEGDQAKAQNLKT